MRQTIHAKGSFYDVGYEIGRQTAKEIAFAHDHVVPRLIEEAFGGNEKRLLDAATWYWKKSEEAFAPAMEFVKGMSIGCNRQIDEILGLVFCEELSLGMPAERCSTLCVWTEDGWIIGHQEDFWPVFLGRMLVYDLEIDGTPRTVSLNYPGNLPHLAGSLNEAGVAITNNSLYLPARQGLPKQVNHFEAALQTEFEMAIAKLSRGPAALNDHFFIASPGERLWSLEVGAPENFGMRADMAVTADRQYGKEQRFAVHTNTVNSLRLPTPDPAPVGSHMRHFRMRAIVEHEDAPTSLDELQWALMERDGIIRRDEYCDWTLQENSVTLATILIAPRKKEIRFVRYESILGGGEVLTSHGL